MQEGNPLGPWPDPFLSLLRVAPPERLYHYTSPTGLQGICKSWRLWATSLFHLNDADEFGFAIDLCKRLLKRAMKRNGSERSLFRFLRTSLDNVVPRWRDHPRDLAPPVYVFSLCETGDLLSQWRGYAEQLGGYSIGFRPEVLRFLASGKCGFLAPCTYEAAAQEALMKYVLALALEHSAITASAEEIAVLFMQNVATIAPFIKNPTFAEEREWRLVIAPRVVDPRMLCFRPGRLGKVPYIEIGLPTGRGHFPIAEIVTGPLADATLAKATVTRLRRRKKIGLSPIPILNSKIPFRRT